MTGPRHLHLAAPQITRADLELARQGIPSRSVTPADIAAACAPRAPGTVRTFSPGLPGRRLLEAELGCPQAKVQFEAEVEAARQDAMAEWAPAEMPEAEPEAPL